MEINEEQGGKRSKDGRRLANIECYPASKCPGWLISEMRDVRARTRPGLIPALLLKKHARSPESAVVVIPLIEAAELIRSEQGPTSGKER